MKYGITLHVYGNPNDEIAADDVADAARQSIFYAQTFFYLLTLIDGSQLDRLLTGADIALQLENVGEIGTMFLSETLTRIDQLEAVRKKAANPTPESEGK